MIKEHVKNICLNLFHNIEPHNLEENEPVQKVILIPPQ